MPNCSVFCCKKRSATSNLQKDGVTFHVFPKDPKLRCAWKDFCNNTRTWVPKRTSAICSTHFQISDFKAIAKNKRRLVEDAIPTLLPDCICASHPLPVGANSSAKPNWLISISEIPSKQQQTQSSSTTATSTTKTNAPKSAAALDCAMCGAELADKIYRCMQCDELTICSACERDNLHLNHCLLRVPSRRIYDALRSVFASLRRELNEKLSVKGDDDEDPFHLGDEGAADADSDSSKLETTMSESTIKQEKNAVEIEVPAVKPTAKGKTSAKGKPRAKASKKDAPTAKPTTSKTSKAKKRPLCDQGTNSAAQPYKKTALESIKSDKNSEQLAYGSGQAREPEIIINSSEKVFGEVSEFDPLSVKEEPCDYVVTVKEELEDAEEPNDDPGSTPPAVILYGSHQPAQR